MALTMGHPNKTKVRKLRCYESIHENTSFLFVHVIALLQLHEIYCFSLSICVEFSY